jgi:hypothetical protein
MTSTMMVTMAPPSHLSLGPAYSLHCGGNRKTGSRLPKTTLLHLHMPSSAPLKPELPESPITPANPRLNLGLGTDEGPEHEHDTGYDGDVEAMPHLPQNKIKPVHLHLRIPSALPPSPKSEISDSSPSSAMRSPTIHSFDSGKWNERDDCYGGEERKSESLRKDYAKMTTCVCGLSSVTSSPRVGSKLSTSPTSPLLLTAKLSLGTNKGAPLPHPTDGIIRRPA